jgi:hypothetical protein
MRSFGKMGAYLMEFQCIQGSTLKRKSNPPKRNKSMALKFTWSNKTNGNGSP